MLYLGTNDKDTGKPVFTQAEALAKAREILMGHFPGFTIQEALSDWIAEDNSEQQEYTLMIYLTDNNEETVHAAADELAAAFNQKSVMIQKFPTTTEFYSGK